MESKLCITLGSMFSFSLKASTPEDKKEIRQVIKQELQVRCFQALNAQFLTFDMQYIELLDYEDSLAWVELLNRNKAYSSNGFY